MYMYIYICMYAPSMVSHPKPTANISGWCGREDAKIGKETPLLNLKKGTLKELMQAQRRLIQFRYKIRDLALPGNLES